MMNENDKENKLLEAIGSIDADLVKKADDGVLRQKRPAYIKYIALAAACVILITAGVLLLPGLFKRSGNTGTPGITPSVTGGEIAKNSPTPVTDPTKAPTKAPTEPPVQAPTQEPTQAPLVITLSKNTIDLMDGYDMSLTAVTNPTEKMLNKATDFAFRLFRACYDGENSLISPLSVSAALGMTMNGAKGATLAGMEETLGMNRDMVNEFIAYFTRQLADDGTLTLANSIWFRETDRIGKKFNVYDDFLNTNALYYNASLYKAPFDESTIKDINNWVKAKTHEMIPELIDPETPVEKLPLMYLINALAFEGKWEKSFNSEFTYSRTFTREDGTTDKADFMSSKEVLSYIDNSNCTGFAKYYNGGRYAFVALLPNEGSTVSALVDKLDGAFFSDLLKNAFASDVDILIPKFKTDYSLELSKVLSSLGMDEAFQELADFSGMSDHKPLFIDCVKHKTFISVDEQGTRAAAVTSVEMTDECDMDYPTVYLNRPFVYMLVDMNTGVPFFTGTMMSME